MIKASRAAGETEREGGRPVEAIRAGRETGGQHMGELKGERGEWRRERSGWGVAGIRGGRSRSFSFLLTSGPWEGSVRCGWGEGGSWKAIG